MKADSLHFEVSVTGGSRRTALIHPEPPEANLTRRPEGLALTFSTAACSLVGAARGQSLGGRVTLPEEGQVAGGAPSSLPPRLPLPRLPRSPPPASRQCFRTSRSGRADPGLEREGRAGVQSGHGGLVQRLDPVQGLPDPQLPSPPPAGESGPDLPRPEGCLRGVMG